MSRHFTIDDLPPRYRDYARRQFDEQQKRFAAALQGRKRTTTTTENNDSSGVARSFYDTAPLREDATAPGPASAGVRGDFSDRRRRPAPERERPAPQKKRGRHGPNKTEERFNREILQGRGLYEAIAFNLPGGSRYLPDYAEFGRDGRLYVYEVKGSYRFPSESRAVLAFRECRALFPEVRFRWYRLTKGGNWVEGHRDD